MPENKKLVILVVEDNDMYRSVVVSALGVYIAGSDVVEATGVKEALRLLQAKHVDVIVADLNLHDGSAIDLVGAAQSFIQAGLRVFVTSCHSREDMQPLLARTDVAGYMEKSHGPRQLAAAILGE